MDQTTIQTFPNKSWICLANFPTSHYKIKTRWTKKT